MTDSMYPILGLCIYLYDGCVTKFDDKLFLFVSISIEGIVFVFVSNDFIAFNIGLVMPDEGFAVFFVMIIFFLNSEQNQ